MLDEKQLRKQIAQARQQYYDDRFKDITSITDYWIRRKKGERGQGVDTTEHKPEYSLKENRAQYRKTMLKIHKRKDTKFGYRQDGLTNHERVLKQRKERVNVH